MSWHCKAAAKADLIGNTNIQEIAEPEDKKEDKEEDKGDKDNLGDGRVKYILTGKTP